ncbi:MAG: cadherin-like domain-containing protein, partial [Bacteroidota bacterium]
MIKHLPKVFTVQDREHHTQLAISAQRGWSAAMAYIFPLFFFFFSFTEVLAQCTPTVSIDRASMMFCEDENTAFDLSVDVSPSKAVFTGSGVMDPDSSDNVATFNPFLAGPGSHRITYVVTSNDGGCISGNRDSITVVVNEIPDAGGDGVAFVCQEMGTGINLFPALVDPMSGGFWSSVRGIMPSGSIGALTDAQIASLGAGVDTFVYTIMGMPPCADSMAQVILTITDVPNTPSSVTVDPICEGDMATVTIEGLEDANYEISYNINGATPLVDTLASTTMTGSFNTDALSTGGMLNILGIRNIDVNPSCDTSVFIARTLTVNPSPHLQGRDTVICDQASFDLRLLVDSIASGDGTEYGTTYGNYNLGSNSIISPLIVGTTTYYVRDSVAATQCVDTTLIRLTVLANPSIVGRDSTICEGSSIDLRLLITGDSVNTLEYGTGSGTGAGYGVYTFSSGSITPMAGVTTYYVRDSSPVAGCVDTAAIVITTTPQPQLRGRDTIICDGMNFDLRLLVDSLVSGDGTEYGPAYGNYSFGSNSIITPMVGIDTFYVRDSVAMTQCVDTTFVVVEVLRTPFITGRDTSICAGESIDLRLLITGDSVNTLEYGTGSGTGAGYGVYTFSSGTITPMAGVTTYYVRDSSPVAGCVDTAAIVITATPQPELLGRDTVICAGMNFDLRLLVDSIVSGDGTEYGDTYGNYNRGGNSIITPMVGIDTFYVRDSVAMTQCVDTTFVVVEVLPTPFIIGRDTSICAGESIDLRLLITGDSVNTLEYGTGSGTGAGYGVYTFSSGTITPMAGMTTYYVRDSSTVAGCVDTAEINVLARPVPMIVGRDTAICSGQDVDLSTLITRTNAGDSLEFGTIFGVYGPQSDSFQMGLTATTTFFVRDSVGFPSCSDTAMIRVTVIDQPLITGSYNSVCPNTEIDLNTLIVGTPTNTLEYGNSYGTYGASNLQVVTANTTFFVRDSSTIAGCVDTARIVVNVYTPPIAGTIIGTTELCVDAIDTLQPTPTSGTTPYTDTLWMSDNPSVVTIDGIGQIKGISNGSANIQYVIIDANGCRDTSSNHTVNVFARPMAGNIVGDTALCIGSTITVNANATLGSPPYTLNWSSVYDTIATIDPLGNVTGINAGTTNLQYIVSDDKGCRDTSPVQLITVDPFPVIGWAISDADTTICQGDEVTFTATGGVSYEFLVNNVTAQATGAANTYQTNSLNDGDQVSAVVTTTAGCQDTSDIIIINVNPIPTASLMSDDADNVIATGQTVTFTATGGVEYAFNINGTLVRDTLASNTFTTSTLNNQDTVIVEVFDGNACTDSASLIITVNAPPIAVNDTLVIMEDALATDILVQANDADPENDPLTTSIVVAPDNGNAIVFSGDTISYFPDANFNGQDSIVYQVCDTEMNCDSATVYITVLPVNDMPVAENDT